MKKFYKLISLLISIMMAVMLLPVQIAKAATTPDGMFFYTINDGNAKVTGLANISYFGSITIPSSITVNQVNYPVTAIGASAFEFNTRINGMLVIPDSVITIEDSAFFECSNITGLDLGSNVESIGSRAFHGCKRISGELILPDSVISIGEGAFSGCSGLVGTPILPDGLISLGTMAFSYCNGLTGQITIPSNLHNFSGSFAYCPGITGYVVNPDNPMLLSDNGVVYDKQRKSLIAYPSGRTGEFSFPDGLNIISNYAFAGTFGLIGSLSFPSSLTTIGSAAFEDCRGLTGSLNIPDTVTTIGAWAFGGCSGLSGNLTIPDGIAGIKTGTFAEISAITDLIIGSNVTFIESHAFSQCRGLSTITIKATSAPLLEGDIVGGDGYTVFFNVPSNAVLYTPNTPSTNTSYDTYPWSKFIKGVVQITEYKLTFNSNGGTSVESQSVVLNQLAIEPTPPTLTGYTFVGWYTDEALTESFDFNTPITENITLYAKWDPELRTVTFDSNDGSSLDPQTVDYNTIATEPSQPTKTGYTFVGWYTNEALTESFDFNTPITENITLYAKWDPELRTVTFDSNDGSSLDPQTVDYNTIATEPSQPTKTGYTFVGWYTDEALTESFDFNTPITENITLYAKWDPEPVDTVISGTNRFDTAALISKQLYDSADTVILTTGRNFPDALSAGPLAVQENAPILLSEVNQIPTETMAEINRLGANKVIILGGQKAIDSSVEETLINQGFTVERISGDTRFLTAIEVAKKVRASSGQLEKAILVNGYGFADALSIGSHAAKEGIPILLTSADSLSPETKTAIDEFGITEIEIIGGDLAVSEAVDDELAGMEISVNRISGSNRFATSAAIAGKYFADSQNAIISTGRGFVDALAAVPLEVHQDAPILLVEKDSLPIEISNYLGGSTIKNFTIVGGELAVSSAVRNEILNVLK